MLYRFDGREPLVGSGTYVSETALVIGDVKIGNDCYIGHGAILRGDYGTIEIGNESTVEEGVIVHAPPQECCSIGNKVIIGHGATVHGRSIGDAVMIGMGAILSIRSKVGQGSTIAEGAVVKREQVIPELTVAGGNPAKAIREVTQQEREYRSWVTELYKNLAHKYNGQGMERIEDG